MLNPIIAWPLTKNAGKSYSKKTQQQKIKKKQRKTYQEVSGTTLKARPDVDGSIGQGPLLGCDPRPLTSAGGRVIPTGSCPACGLPQPMAWDFPTRVAAWGFLRLRVTRRAGASLLPWPPGFLDRIRGRRGILRLRVTC